MFYVVVNPSSKSGRGLQIWKELEPILIQRNVPYQVSYSQYAGHVSQLVEELCRSVLTQGACDVLKLIILGGDGTFNEALQGITDFERVQIGYIPTGSSNDLARDLRLTDSPQNLLLHILDCTTPFRMDLGCLTYNSTPTVFSRLHKEDFSSTQYFAVSCGIGYDAAICEEALSSKFKNFLNRIGCGKLTYVAIALKQLVVTRRGNCTLTLDGKPPLTLDRFLFVASMIHQYEGGGFMFCPNADYNDGILNICAVGPIAKPRILLALPSALKGQHYKYPHIHAYQASEIRIDADDEFWVHTDGEVSVKCNSITIKCLQNKIMLLK